MHRLLYHVASGCTSANCCLRFHPNLSLHPNPPEARDQIPPVISSLLPLLLHPLQIVHPKPSWSYPARRPGPRGPWKLFATPYSYGQRRRRPTSIPPSQWRRGTTWSLLAGRLMHPSEAKKGKSLCLFPHGSTPQTCVTAMQLQNAGAAVDGERML